ncbi:MAG: SAM-dependent methyltransferase, partial [Desulfobulbaceae bacterium A2]
LYDLTAPGGSVWISDLVAHELAPVEGLMRQRYADYLLAQGGPDYRDTVLASIEQEDSPRPVTWQMDLLRRVGFRQVELLHKNGCFAAFGAVR